MRLGHHITVSTVISGILYFKFRSWELSIASLIAGIFIDIDHVFDYIIHNGLIFKRKRFFDFFYKEKHQKITLILHGWEWLIILTITAKMTNWNPWITGAFIGYVTHIVSDFFYNKATLGSYSVFWRWKNGFDSKIIFPRDRGYPPFTDRKKEA